MELDKVDFMNGRCVEKSSHRAFMSSGDALRGKWKIWWGVGLVLLGYGNGFFGAAVDASLVVSVDESRYEERHDVLHMKGQKKRTVDKKWSGFSRAMPGGVYST
jgi:hypothetical protein